MKSELVLDQMVTTGVGGCHHSGRHTGKYFRMDLHALLSDPVIQDLREASDAVEALCQVVEGRQLGGRP
jgi:hypothetical protein